MLGMFAKGSHQVRHAGQSPSQLVDALRIGRFHRYPNVGQISDCLAIFAAHEMRDCEPSPGDFFIGPESNHV
jgi:hypothetical protein